MEISVVTRRVDPPSELIESDFLTIEEELELGLFYQNKILDFNRHCKYPEVCAVMKIARVVAISNVLPLGDEPNIFQVILFTIFHDGF